MPLPTTDPDADATDAAVVAALEIAVGYGALVIGDDADALVMGGKADALDLDAGVEDADAGALEDAGAELETAAVVDAGAEAAVLAQAQTALAEDWTERPVSAPQAWTTQPRAAEAMAADWEALHWQAKSVGPQPTPLPAERMQDWAHWGIFAAAPRQASWATALATRPRARITETDFILVGWK